MIKTIILISLFLFSSTGFAQNGSIDSISSILSSSSIQSRDKAVSLLELYGHLKGEAPDTVFRLSDIADSLLKKETGKSTDSIRAEFHLKKGERYKKKNNLSKALEEFHSAYILFSAHDIASRIKNTEFVSGQIFHTKGDYDTAIVLLKSYIAYHEKEGNRALLATGLSNLGLSYYEISRYNDAFEVQYKSASIRKKQKDTKSLMGQYGNISLLHQETGDIDSAIIYAEKCMVLADSLGDKESAARINGNLGNLHHLHGEFADAMFRFETAYEIYKSTKNTLGEAKTLNNIGIIHKEQGNFDKAVDYLRRSMILKETTGDLKAVSISYMNIGLVYKLKNMNDSALYYYQKSLALKRKVGDVRGEAYVLNNIGVLKKESGAYRDALSVNTESIALKEKINDQIGLCTAFNNSGACYIGLGSYDSAMIFTHRALRLSESLGYTTEIQNARFSLYQLFIRSGNRDSAMMNLTALKQLRDRDMEKTLVTLPENEKQEYLQLMEHDYGLVHDFALSYSQHFPGITDTCYAIALKNKNLALKSGIALRRRIRESGDANLISQYASWIELKKKIAIQYSEGENTNALVIESDKLEKKLSASSQSFREFNEADIDWKKIRDRLDKDEACVEFLEFRSEIDSAHPVKYAALIIKHGIEHPIIVEICTQKTLQTAMKTKNGDPYEKVKELYGTLRESETALYDIIWSPIDPFLDGMKTIHYSPAGMLYKVSFASLSPYKGRFLCDDYELNLVGSTSTLASGEKKTGLNEGRFFILGDVRYRSDSSSNEVWEDLIGSAKETHTIIELLNTKKRENLFLQQDEASEVNVKKMIGEFDVAHFSTHGFFFADPDSKEETIVTNKTDKPIRFRGSTEYAEWNFIRNKNPLMRSGLVLAQANDIWFREKGSIEKEDGILTAMEVSNMELSKIKLVVLSACETGLGDIKGSEGVYGLQRAFKMAGVKNIIMSLWQIPDGETAEFMVSFYNNLLKEQEIHKAFNKTQNTMRAKYDPFFWGAFVLIE